MGEQVPPLPADQTRDARADRATARHIGQTHLHLVWRRQRSGVELPGAYGADRFEYHQRDLVGQVGPRGGEEGLCRGGLDRDDRGAIVVGGGGERATPLGAPFAKRFVIPGFGVRVVAASLSVLACGWGCVAVRAPRISSNVMTQEGVASLSAAEEGRARPWSMILEEG